MGVNKRRFIRGKSTFDCSTHAEIDLLNKLGKRAHGSKIYLYRFNNTTHVDARKVKNAKPCVFCQHALKAAGVARVYYVNDHGEPCVLKNRDMTTVIADPSNITHHFLKRCNGVTNGQFFPKKYLSDEYRA